MKQENFQRALEIRETIDGLKSHLDTIGMGSSFQHQLPSAPIPSPDKDGEDEEDEEDDYEDYKGRKSKSPKSTPSSIRKKTEKQVWLYSSLFMEIGYAMPKCQLYDEFLPEGSREGFMELYRAKVIRRIESLEQEFSLL